MKADALLTLDGRYDRREIMRDAHRQRRQMMRHGWTWSRCLAFSWSKAKMMRARLNADRDKVEKTSFRSTFLHSLKGSMAALN